MNEKRKQTAVNPEKRNAYMRKWNAANPERVQKYRLNANRLRPWEKAYAERVNGAKKRGVAYTLTRNDLRAIWTGKCAITGLPFDTRMRPGGKSGPRPFSPSLDRIKPSLGYTLGNVRFVLHCVNAFRGRMTDRLMLRVAEKIVAGMSVVDSKG